MGVIGSKGIPTSSQDSHNFGFISKNIVLGLKRGQAGLTGFEPATDGLRVRRST